MKSISLTELEPEGVSSFLSGAEALERYEMVTGARINRNKPSGLLLDIWKGVAFPGPFSWADGTVRILEMLFEPKKNWLEVLAKVGASVRT